MWRRIVAARFALWVLLLVAVPICALVAGLDTWGIVGAAVIAYALVVVAELVLVRRERPQPSRWPQRRAPRRPVRVVEPEPERRDETVKVIAVADPSPQPALEPEPEPEPEREPVVLAAVPDPEPEPEP